VIETTRSTTSKFSNVIDISYDFVGIFEVGEIFTPLNLFVEVILADLSFSLRLVELQVFQMSRVLFCFVCKTMC